MSPRVAGAATRRGFGSTFLLMGREQAAAYGLATVVVPVGSFDKNRLINLTNNFKVFGETRVRNRSSGSSAWLKVVWRL